MSTLTKVVDDEVVPTRVLIISDTHNAALEKDATPEDDAANTADSEPHSIPFKKPLPKADVLIHCGDMTGTGTMAEYHQTLDMLAMIDAPVKLVIAGNHDRTLDREWMKKYPDRNPGGLTIDQSKALWQEATDLWYAPDGRAVKEGVRMLDEGMHRIPLENGAFLTIYATPYTPDFYQWGFAYQHHEDRFNPAQTTLIGGRCIAENPIPSFSEQPIDILVTHGPPYANLDRTDSGVLAGCPHILRALMRSRPLIHCFGHIHEGWGAERIAWPPSVDEVATRSTTIKKFKSEWADEIAENGIVSISTDEESMTQKHCVELDVTSTSKKPLHRGRESLLVNAAIMDVNYRPENAPWLVMVDLPRAAVKGGTITEAQLARSQTV